MRRTEDGWVPTTATEWYEWHEDDPPRPRKRLSDAEVTRRRQEQIEAMIRLGREVWDQAGLMTVLPPTEEDK
jgi:hypothetical protein